MQPQTQTHTTWVTVTLAAVNSSLSEGIVIIEDTIMPNHMSHDNLLKVIAQKPHRTHRHSQLSC
jgi:hypothetical protein